MLRLIADLNLIVTEGGREDRKDRGEIRQGRKKDGQTQAKKSVCEKCNTSSRGSLKNQQTVKMVVGRGREEVVEL